MRSTTCLWSVAGWAEVLAAQADPTAHHRMTREAMCFPVTKRCATQRTLHIPLSPQKKKTICQKKPTLTILAKPSPTPPLPCSSRSDSKKSSGHCKDCFAAEGLLRQRLERRAKREASGTTGMSKEASAESAVRVTSLRNTYCKDHIGRKAARRAACGAAEFRRVKAARRPTGASSRTPPGVRASETRWQRMTKSKNHKKVLVFSSPRAEAYYYV